MLLTIIIFISILCVLVVVHEAGHFFVARQNGVKVEEFGFGIPPRIFGAWRDKHKKWHFVGRKIPAGQEPPETVYSINWLPIGGFVKIKGEDGENTDPDSFSQKKLWQRSLIVGAGVTMNFLLTIVLLSVGFGIGIPTALDGNLGAEATVRDRHIEIVSVLKDSPAARAGLQAGYTILKIDGREFPNLQAARDYIKEAKGKELVLQVKTDGHEETKRVKTELLPSIKQYGLGVALFETGLVSYPWYLAVAKGTTGAFSLLYEILRSFYGVFRNLFAGRGVGADLSGPVGIAVLTGKVARLGFSYLLQFMALLSINLAVINAVPFPALDGGRLLFFLIEKIKGKPVSKKAENLAHNIGFIILLGLILLVTLRDVGGLLGFKK